MSEFAQKFRDAMANLSAAVHIVTSNGLAGKVGITVSSVCSVTDSPPTLLFCVNQQSDLHDVLKQNRYVCVNILNHQQEDLAKHFAGMLGSTMAERFEWDLWIQGQHNVPLLRQAIANLQGEIIETHPVGSHSIFVVQLSEIDLSPNHCLVYFDRQFKKVAI
ncbi:MAG: 4-hydroxyphenylacetate 3-monooxygenase, reductase component [Pasteurellaceae bacterium]|nr:4-hydroxyphenylacetate 3-monooxygenase, reductase component [Pasteurellaceae bacterium]